MNNEWEIPFRTGVSHCFFIKNHLFSIISHSYLSHHSKYIRCGLLYLFKAICCLYVKSLYPIRYPIYIIVLSNWHLHRSTRVNSPYHLGERISSLLCNDLFTRVERWKCQLVNTQTLVDKQVKPGYTTCKEAVNGQITTILMGNYSMNWLGIPL